MMGGFVLLPRQDHQAVERRVRRVFEARGFRAPTRFEVGERVLLLFSKQLDGRVNFACAAGGDAVYAVGAPIYRELGYTSGIGRLLEDLGSERVDLAELRGAYGLIFQRENNLELVTDAANLFHVFCSVDGGVISTSMEAVVAAKEGPVALDRDALLEQLIAGFIAPPTTPYEGVILLDQLEQRTRRWPGIRCRPHAALEPGEGWHGSRVECADHQNEALRESFRAIRAVAGEVGTSIGLSAGYDSRLLLALALDAGLPISAHTFDSTAHGLEAAVAEELAAAAGVSCERIPVRRWEILDDETLRVSMDDALGYWDGRCNATQGSFSDVHTRSCRVGVLGGPRLGLSGHGGELFRNRESLPPWPFPAKGWMRASLTGTDGWRAITGGRDLTRHEEHLREKYARLVPELRGRAITREVARKWYARVWLPFGAGPKLCAENQVSLSLVAFGEERVIREALRATPVIGFDGELEAAMIGRLNRKLAEIRSAYGHSLSGVPWQVVARAGLLGALPPRIRHFGGRAARLLKNGRLDANKVEKRREHSLLAPLKSLSLPICWPQLLEDDDDRSRACFVAGFLKRLGA